MPGIAGAERAATQSPVGAVLAADQGVPPELAAQTAELQAVAALLAGARSAVILAHVNPDADALGSALALGLALRTRGADVQVSFAEPAAVPRSLEALPGLDLVVPVEKLERTPDLVVTVDVNAASRIGSLADFYRDVPMVVIDHHATNSRFGTSHLVDPAAESTTVLVARLLDELRLPITKDIAANLYAGLATDSVGFRFAGAQAHRLAARLLDAGVRPVELMERITDEHPVAWLPMLARVLGRAELEAVGEIRVVWTTVGLSDSADVGQEELDSVIDILRTIRDADVAAVLKQSAVGEWQASLRSNGRVDVARVAAVLGGGGHARAAGFGWSGETAELLEQLRATLARHLPSAGR